MQVDWEHAAKDSGDGLPRIAVELRERTRRALLLEFAPTSVQNDWGASPAGAAPLPGRPLDGLHPVCAQGVVAFVESAQRSLAHRAWLNLYRAFPSVKATAALLPMDRPVPTGV